MTYGSRFLTAAVSVALCAAVPARSALAQVPVGAAPNAAPLLVWVEAGGSALDQQRLRRSLARELKREVALTNDAGAATLRIQLASNARAQVQYTTPSGQHLTREVELPPDSQRSLEVVSWLAVNLVRDEASELLDELRARRKQEADARGRELLAAEEKAAAEKAAADKAAADKAAADKAAADKAAAEKAAADKAAADKAAADARRKIELDVEPEPNAGLLKDPIKSFDLAFVSPASVIHDSKKRELRLQLALVYGEAGGIRGVAVSPGALRIRQDVLGHTLAGGAVFVGGDARGTIIGAGYSQLDGNLNGVQVGGGMALQRGKLARGVVASAGAAVAGGLYGVVVGGGVASARSLEGVALSAGVAAVRGPAEGLLVGAGGTFAQDVRGMQVAAGLNISRDLQGVAVAPINVQRKVRGLQLGIVNVAEEVDGAAIGVISVSKDGRVQPVLWGDNAGSAHVALKSIAGYVFTQLGGGVDLTPNEVNYDAGIGGHVRLTPSIFLEPGVHYSGSHSVGTVEADIGLTRHELHYLVGAGLRLGNKVDLLAAGGARHTFSGQGQGDIGPEVRFGLALF